MILCSLYIFSNREKELFPFGNELMVFVYDISVSMIAAGVFYLFQVYLPEKNKKNIIKENFKKYWHQTKKNIILILLQSLGQGAINIPGIVEKLCKPKAFTKYFSDNSKIEGQTNRQGVLNGLSDGTTLIDLRVEFELLIKHIDFILLKIEINDEEIIDFLKRLQTTLYYNREINFDYGEDKALSRFLWDVLGGQDFFKGGHRDYDIVESIIKKI